MRSLLALICPPVAVMASGSRSDVVTNVALTVLFIIPGVVHALGVVDRFATHRQYDSVMRAMERSGS